jgi:hypothetical protein
MTEARSKEVEQKGVTLSMTIFLQAWLYGVETRSTLDQKKKLIKGIGGVFKTFGHHGLR